MATSMARSRRNCAAATSVSIVHKDAAGNETVLKAGIALQAGEIIDSSVMSKSALRAFLAEQIDDARAKDVLFSLHMKATMMKVSDPIIFGHAVTVFYADAFAKHGATFEKLGVDVNNGIGDVYAKIKALPAAERAAIEADLPRVTPRAQRWRWSTRIAALRIYTCQATLSSTPQCPPRCAPPGQMWGPDGNLKDMKAVIPDRCYAGVYQEVIDFCKANGALGSVDHGQCAECWSHGTESRRVRLARQDLRDPSRRYCVGYRCSGRGASKPRRRSRATSGACAKSKTRRFKTGSSSRLAARDSPIRRQCSGSTKSVPTTAS
jgi:monomeric type NADP-dependent isocitrate dehydrogenase